MLTGDLQHLREFRSGFFATPCPEGKAAMGGGVSIVSRHGDAYYVNSLMPVENGWGSEVYNDTAETLLVDTYATCATGIVNRQVVGGTPDPVRLSGHTSATLVVDCPAGTLLLGGGVNTAGDRTIITKSHPVFDRRWSVGVYNRTSADELVRAFAVCGN